MDESHSVGAKGDIFGRKGRDFGQLFITLWQKEHRNMGSRLSKYGNRYGTYVTLLAIPAMCFALLRLEGDVLFRAQELSLFLFSRHFYERLCIYPGGTLSWLACLVYAVGDHELLS